MLGQYADDGSLGSVEGDLRSDESRISGERAPPHALADDDHRGSGRSLVARVEQAAGQRSGNPWSDQSNSSLARDAGLDDIGRSDSGSRAGYLDQAALDRQQDAEQDADMDQDAEQDAAMDMDSDDYGNDDNGSDYA